MRAFVIAATGAALIALAPINEASALTVNPFSLSGTNVQLNNDPLDVGETGSAIGLLGKIGPFSDLQDSFTFTPDAPLVRVRIGARRLNVSGQTYTLGGAPTAFSFGSPFTVPVSQGSVNTLVFDITVPGAFGGAAYRVNVTPVPLPAALPLMGAALAGLALVRRRRKSDAPALNA